jgi:hypothetical protein
MSSNLPRSSPAVLTTLSPESDEALNTRLKFEVELIGLD